MIAARRVVKSKGLIRKMPSLNFLSKVARMFMAVDAITSLPL
jgi:hypothetical protein